MTTFTSPAPGHAPILVVVGEDKAHYEPVWPPTITISKETALEPAHQKITWGSGQLDIAEGVLDAVAEDLMPCAGDLIVFIVIYTGPSATDETAMRVATLKGVRTALEERAPEAHRALVERRDSLRRPFYTGS